MIKPLIPVILVMAFITEANPILVEGESLAMWGKSREQGMKHYGTHWRGDSHLLWDGVVGDALTTEFNLPKDSRYRLRIQMTGAPDYGVFSLTLNNRELRKGIDTYAPKVKLGPRVDLGEMDLKAGKQTLGLTLTGANAKARKFRGKGYLTGIDFIEITDMKAPIRKIPDDPLQVILAEHCHRCHGGEKTKGKLDLVALSNPADLAASAKVLEDMLAVLRDHEMPPDDEPQLPGKTHQTAITLVDKLLKDAVANQPFPPTPLRRMNRFQYNNAVVDLLGLDRDIFSLPERLMWRKSDYFQPSKGRMPNEVRLANRPLGKDRDGARPEGFKGVAAFPQDRRAEHGFDNRADHLTLSPLLMESFLQLSQSIVDSKDLNSRECRSWKPIFETPRSELRKTIGLLLRRSYRRPVSPETLNRFANFAEANLDAGKSMPETMKSVISAIISSPDFLYIYDDARGGNARQKVNDFELASRLSWLFWSSLPDDPLLDLAQAGTLKNGDVLAQQIDRMLNDSRSARFCDAFPSQWLQLDRLITSIPDPKKFGYFYFSSAYRASMHMMMEPLLLFETAYIENRSVMDLLDPRYTWHSDVLASCYKGGKDMRSRDVYSFAFRRVPVTDRRYGGVITNAATLTMTSAPDHTLPITRGAWINTVIFNDPPDPPPADIPPLPKADPDAEEKLTIRERFAEHRKREDCAGCHKQIDPLGFALENYGPTGVWRDRYDNGREVDPSGMLFDRAAFATAVQFKDLVVQERRRFYRGFAGHLLAYALGREVAPQDAPALDHIADEAMRGSDQLRTILKLVATSEPFLHK